MAPPKAQYALAPLDEARANEVMTGLLAPQGAHLIEVRARGPNMVACLVSQANLASVRLCKSLGLDIKRGASGVIGLAGEDAARLFSGLSPHQRAWLGKPSGPQETKVILVAGGIALLSLLVVSGKVEIIVIPSVVQSGITP